MKKNRSRVQTRHTAKRKRKAKYRKAGAWGIAVILMLGIVFAYYKVKAGISHESISQEIVSEEELPMEEQEEEETDTTYYQQEAGVIESILTETNHIVYSVHYPKFMQQEIDMDIYQLVKELIQKAENSDARIDRLEDRGMLYMNYDSYLVGQNIVSIIFYIEYNSTKTNTPEIYTISKHYALSNGEKLENDDLFKNGYLNELSQYCMKELSSAEEFQELMKTRTFRTKLKAKEKNYSNLSLTKEGVQVTFSKEQIPSSKKEYQITVPYEVLKDYLRFDYQSEMIEIEKEEESTIIESEKPILDLSRPMIALTFDDGPNPPVTERILDVLKQYNSRATFYVVGNRLRNYPDTLKRILTENSEIGSHTYNHKSLTLLNAKEMKKELSGVEDYLGELLNIQTATLRPPYGAVNDLVRKTVKKPMIYWSIDTEDWKSRNTKMIINQVTSRVKDGDIILFHDLYDTTASAVEQLVPRLAEEGYQIVTVSELFEAKGIALEDGKVYYSAR